MDEFIVVVAAIEEGKGEPEPNNGQSPSFIPAPPAQDDRDQNWLQQLCFLSCFFTFKKVLSPAFVIAQAIHAFEKHF